jgi:hypothetical protein
MAPPRDGLESARLKIIRAREHHDAIANHIAAYRSRNPYEIVVQPDGTEKVSIHEEPPRIISVLAGELLYQVRSALEHLVFELVKSNPSGIALPDGWEDRCQFPIFFKLPKGVINPPVPKHYFVSKLPGLSDAAYTYIELLQPYNRRNEFGFLQVLTKLSNIDKHRYLNVTVASVGRHELVTGADGQLLGVRIQAGLSNGAELKSPNRLPDAVSGAVNVERSTFVNVVFREPSIKPPDALPPVQAVLHSLICELRDGIIPTFQSLMGGS